MGRVYLLIHFFINLNVKRMKKNFLLLFLMALLPLAGWAAELVGTTQYDVDGFQYKILTLDAAKKTGTVSVSQNVYGTNGAAALEIKDYVTINVEGEVSGTPVKANVKFTIVEIEANGFKDVKNCTSITIGKNIKTIGASAFEGCTNVTEITFAENTNDVDIKDDVFKGTKPTELDLTPLKNTKILRRILGGSATFTSGTVINNTLTTVKFPAKLTTINKNVFAGCTELSTVVFPETKLAAGTYLTIAEGVFQETAIVDLDLTEAKIQTLNKLFEDNNVTLKTVKMSKYVKTLNTNALANCIQLNSVDFSKAENLTTLKAGSLSNTVVTKYDFSKCYTLTTATPPAYNTYLTFSTDENPFVNATTTTNKNLQTVILPYDEDLAYSPVNVIATAFANCEKLTTIEHLEVSKIIAVADCAFAGDISLTELSFPASLTQVNGSPFKKGVTDKSSFCEKLKKLTFDGSANVTIGNGSNLFGLAAGTVCPLEELYITVPAKTEKVTTSATISDVALTNTGADSKLKKVEIAKDGIFAGTINAFALAEGVDAEVVCGDIANATLNSQITGPVGTKKTKLTIGNWGITSAATAAIIKGIVSEATVGKVTEGSVVIALGQAEKIEFTGDITANLSAPTSANEVLTEIDFNKIKIAAGAIAATVFDETKAPNLTKVTWQPKDDDATKAFDKAAFGTDSKGTNAKVTLTTTTKVAVDLYSKDEVNELHNVIFDADDPEPEAAPTTMVYGTATSAYFYGKYTAPAAKNIAIDKKDGDVVVYSAFVDTDNNIYMDPLALNDGRYIVEKGQTVIIRAKASSVEAKDMTKPAGGKEAKVEFKETTDASTMRYRSGETKPFNALQVTDKVFSSDYIGTKYVGKTLYAMKNPASVGQLAWGKVDVSSYLPKDALFVECSESAAARLNVIWLDGNATGIDEILNKKATSAAQSSDMYTLQGVRISAPKKGQVYIMNGKKYLAK